MLDGDPAWRLANISRRLAWLDYQGGRPNHLAGTAADRNATLLPVSVTHRAAAA